MNENDGNPKNVLTGKDILPSFLRRDFLNVASIFGVAVLLAACGVDPDQSLIQAQATRQAELPEGERIENILPRWELSGLTGIHITPLTQASSYKAPFGTGQVYMETKDHLVVVTAEHVGRGVVWRNVRLSFPFGYENTQINIDARIGARNGSTPTPDDWWIQGMTDYSDPDNGIYRPIRAIVIKKPDGYDQFVTRPEYGVLTPYTGELRKGDRYYCGGFSTDLRGGLVFSEVKYQGETTSPDYAGGLPLYLFNGPGDNGMSGSMIMTKRGESVAIVSGGVQERRLGWRDVYGIPFAQFNPLTDILRIIQS
jgi:hypothetical protein